MNMECTTEGCNNNVLRCDTKCSTCAAEALTRQIKPTAGRSAMVELLEAGNAYRASMHKAIGDG